MHGGRPRTCARAPTTLVDLTLGFARFCTRFLGQVILLSLAWLACYCVLFGVFVSCFLIMFVVSLFLSPSHRNATGTNIPFVIDTNTIPNIGNWVFEDANGSSYLNDTNTIQYYIIATTAFGVRNGVVVSSAACT